MKKTNNQQAQSHLLQFFDVISRMKQDRELDSDSYRTMMQQVQNMIDRLDSL
jgi:hypothetical protein